MFSASYVYLDVTCGCQRLERIVADFGQDRAVISGQILDLKQ